ncbi:hypothetical protein [Bacillus pseudomycoides]|uniref:hypothetical protein n=1 Tax=Bacillus pseudomycoides TaxID=64104 RepID=UPI000BEF8147|nr:hypothetical protein [Bacillus pseudomycoides]PEK65940.1 hypothetical protein CN590_17550 [Bacillus pseudomycoides]
MQTKRPKRGEFFIYEKDERAYQVLAYSKMFEHEEQEIIILKRMKDNMNITISAELFILYIEANKFIKDKVLVSNL